MTSSLESALLRSLNLKASGSKVSSHGHSGFAGTYRITTPSKSIFVKHSSSPPAQGMLKGEHESLSAIHRAVPDLCPESFAWGELEDNQGCYLATEFVDLSRMSSGKSGGKDLKSQRRLAVKLAELHQTPAPIPEGYDKPQFGFPVTTCCGDTPQDNTFASSWADFFGKRRLLAVLERAEKNNGRDSELRRVVEQTVQDVVPSLLRDGHLGGEQGIHPALVHGDLWSGNSSQGLFIDRKAEGSKTTPTVQDVVFDPSSSYAHHEFDFGIMNMFGSFGTSFWQEYHNLVPKTEPAEEYPDRVALYESYHHLNHYAIFGGSYKTGAMKILL